MEDIKDKKCYLVCEDDLLIIYGALLNYLYCIRYGSCFDCPDFNCCSVIERIQNSLDIIENGFPGVDQLLRSLFIIF